MASSSSKSEQSTVNEKIDIKDFESLLQQCYRNKYLKVVNYVVTKLLPDSENISSIMVKIDAKVRKTKSIKEETIYLVGKTPVPAKANPYLCWPLTFEKECFMYGQLFPVYRALEKEVGIDETDIIDVLPRYIGHRNPPEDCDDIDKDSILLLENLNIKGFQTENKLKGMDVDHARKALTSLARFHALGIAMKQKLPSFTKEAIEQAKILAYDYDHINGNFLDICLILKSHPRSKKHSVILEESFEQRRDGRSQKAVPTEPWATIIHGDFWTSNILFHKDDEDNVDDVKFVDFQGYLYNSPQKDIAFFLGCSVDIETQTNHLEDLLNLYYDVFIKTLQRMDCDPSPFTKESFDAELKRQAVVEFLLNALAHQIFISEANKGKNNEESKSIEESTIKFPNVGPNDPYIDKWLWLVEVYERMNWF